MENLFRNHPGITASLIAVIILLILPSVWPKVASKFRKKPKKQTLESFNVWGIESLPKGSSFKVISIHPVTKRAVIHFHDLSHEMKEEFKGSILTAQFKERTFHKLEVGSFYVVKGMEVVWEAPKGNVDDISQTGTSATLSG